MWFAVLTWQLDFLIIMVLYSDTGLSKLTSRKPADTAQASLIVGDNSQSFIYHDLTGSLSRLAPAQLAYLKFSGFVFWNIQNRLVSKICKLADASASLHQSQFNSHHLFPLLTLTRSVKTSYLSQYLQHPTLTSDILLKYFDHLITFIIAKPAHKQLRPTLQILRHTHLATGTVPCQQTGHRPVSFAG